MSKKNFVNSTRIEGRIYDHKLEERTVKNESSKNFGQPFIAGDLQIATDDDCMNVVTIHYSYVTPVTKNGGANATYNTLKNIITGKSATVVSAGKEAAALVRCDSAIALNEFYDRNNEFVSVKRNEGGFIRATNEININPAQRATFNTDIVITSCTRKEADDERNIPERMTIHGAIFDFRKALLPVDFTVLSPAAMDYFESLEASNTNPVFTEVWGEQISTTVVRTITKESAFDVPSVTEIKSSHKDYVITGANPETYVWDDESSILASEFKEMMAEREVHLADIKKRTEESRQGTTTAAAPAKGDYNF